MTRRLLIGSLVLVSAVGCGKSAEQQQKEEATKKIEQGAAAMQQGAAQVAEGAQGNAQMAEGLQQMAQGFQQMAQGSAKAVDFEVLVALLPQLSGWTQSSPKGEQLTMPMQHSEARASYTKGESRIQLQITDSALSQMLLAPMTMFLATGYSERSDEGFKRAGKVGGYPGFEEWRNTSKHGEVTALVNNRFIVTAKGDDIDRIDVARQAVEAVDLKKLAELK